ncbi:MAG: hypothetical protein AAF939_10670 [Planctomycetota bacterium]
MKRNLIHLLMVALPLCGLTAILLVFCFPPVIQPDTLQAKQPLNLGIELLPNPDIESLSRLIQTTRLRQPLDPKPPAETPKPVQSPAVRWPPIQLDCILSGSDSKVAVLLSNGQKYRCTEGDRFLNMEVTQISNTYVELTLQGQSKIFGDKSPQ